MSLRQYTKKYFYTDNSNNLISLEYGTVCYAPRTLQNSYQTFNSILMSKFRLTDMTKKRQRLSDCFFTRNRRN